MKNKLTQEYLRRIRGILKTRLTDNNKLANITTVLVLQHSFGIIKWTLSEIRAIDRKTRKQMTIPGAPHPRSDVDTLSVLKRNGGGGLTHDHSGDFNARTRTIPRTKTTSQIFRVGL